MNTIKKNLRQQFLSRRDELNPLIKKKWDHVIHIKLLELFEKLKPKVVHTYLPIGSEVDLYQFIQFLLDHKVKVVCPVTLQKPYLAHRELESLHALEQGRSGTKHPKGGNDYHGDYDLIIVPGIAFNEKNYRLGYGGGYYDYFLKSQSSTLKLGLFYSSQKITDLPIDTHDIPLNIILTN
jgi:5-formyltetrahydrofolate cyclo-ligase